MVLGSRYAAPCTYVTVDGVCGATPTRRFLPGRRCQDHTPAALAGRPEDKPDPTRTIAGIRKAAGLDPTRSWTPTGETAIDDAAKASGKRRASQHEQRQARTRREAHR